MSPQPGVPVLRQVVLDTTDVRALAEFYRRLLDLQYSSGDEHPGADAPDPRGQDWLVLRRLDASTALAFQNVEQRPSATWPNGPHAQMLHFDLTVLSSGEIVLLGSLSGGSNTPQVRQRRCVLRQPCSRAVGRRSCVVQQPCWEAVKRSRLLASAGGTAVNEPRPSRRCLAGSAGEGFGEDPKEVVADELGKSLLGHPSP